MLAPTSLVALSASTLLLLSLSCSAATSPGLKVRLSQPALDYASTVTMEILSAKLLGMSLPDVSGTAHIKVGKVDYQVQGMKVNSFQRPTCAVTVNPGSGLTWLLSNAAISIHGNWRYKAHIGPIPIRDHGTFDASVSGVTLRVSVTLGISPSGTGKPTIASTGCSADLRTLHIRTHGGASWLYNLFMKQIARPIRSTLQKQICHAADTAINVQVAGELATLKDKVIIKDHWLLDYKMVSAPHFAAGYLESFHKGEFFYATDPSTEAPFLPGALPSAGNCSERMVTFWVSEYVLNTLGYVLHRHGAMRGTFTKDDLPADLAHFLDTSCALQCIGKIVPAISRAFPHATVEIQVTTLAAPTADIEQQRVVGNLVQLAVLLARLSNGSTAHLFDLNVTATVSLLPRLRANVLSASVDALDESMAVLRTSIGPVDITLLRVAAVIAKNRYIIPKLNGTLSTGFPLPTIKHVTFNNTGLHLMKDCARITTDITYKQDADNNVPATATAAAATESHIDTKHRRLHFSKFRVMKKHLRNIGTDKIFNSATKI